MTFNILNPDTFKPPLRSPIPNSKADIGTVAASLPDHIHSKDQRSCANRLLEASNRLRPAVPTCYDRRRHLGGSPHVQHEAARVRQLARRSGGCVAARRARAAAGDAGDRRPQQPDPRNRERKNWGRSPRVERDRLRRGSKRGDRVSLRGRPWRPRTHSAWAIPDEVRKRAKIIR
jgi:hypothetical protein